MSNPGEKVVKLSDYNKLKLNYERLKKRNDKLNSENRNLKDMVENMIKNYDAIEESKLTTDNLIKELNKTFLNLTTSHPKSKEEYSTTTSSIEFISAVRKNNKIKNKENEIIGINQLLIRKVDEMEATHNEICKSFNNTIKKYKLIKQDYDEVNSSNVKLLQEIHLMRSEINMLSLELNERQGVIERFKEIDKCLVDSSLGTMVLNTNDHKKISREESSNIKNVPYIICEPIPSFLKFLNKAY